MNEQAIDNATAFAMLKSVMAAHDDNFYLWPKQSVKFARGQWRKHQQGQVPSVDAVVNHIGAERALELAKEVVKWRAFDNALKGYQSPCHYCGSEHDLVPFDFALMRVNETKHELGGTLVSAAISAMAIPLLGVGALKLPGKSFQGVAYHLKLAVCKPCCKREGNIFGLFMINEKRASKHPMWDTLQEAGFTKFFDREKMPGSFRMDFGQHL